MSNPVGEESVALYIRIQDGYVHVLNVPKSHIGHYAKKPYKWFWFLAYIIFGRSQIDGSFSANEEGEPFTDTEMESDEMQHDKLYYKSSADDHRLVDVYGANTRKGTSVVSSRNRDEVEAAGERDHDSCVMTGDDEMCEVCHLIPHSKGDKYIMFVTGDLNPAIENIDSVQNLLTLNRLAHTALGQSKLAFLQTPNFRLKRTDLPDPVLGRRVRQPSADDSSRLTVHHFPVRSGSNLQYLCPNNADIWQSNDKDSWPPQVIFNFVYALAIIKRWGTDDFSKRSQEENKDMYEKMSQETANKRKRDAEEEKPDQQNQEQEERFQRRRRDREGQAGQGSGIPGDAAAIALACFWDYNRRRTAHIQSPSTRTTPDIDTNQKVGDWLKGTS